MTAHTLIIVYWHSRQIEQSVMLMNAEARTVSVLQDVFSFLEDHRCPTGSCSSHREDVLGIRGDVKRLLQCGTAAPPPAVDQTHLGVSSALRDPCAACAIGQLHAVRLGLESVIEALELCQVIDDMRSRTGVHHQALSGDTALWLTGHKLEHEGVVIRLLGHSARCLAAAVAILLAVLYSRPGCTTVDHADSLLPCDLSGHNGNIQCPRSRCCAHLRLLG